MVSTKLLHIATAILVAVICYTSALAQKDASTPKPTDEAKRAQSAAAVVAEMMQAPDREIPEALLKRAIGIAVIPHVVKGAFGIGGRYGKGLVAQRDADGGWGTPLFIEIGGGSFGLQLGVEATDVIMVFTNHEGIMPLLKGKLKIGADASATAGPVGRKAEAGTDILLKSAIYSYSRSKGVFAGVALDGAVMKLDQGANKKVYGKNVVAADTAMETAGASALAVVEPFLRVLRQYAPNEFSSAVSRQ